MVALALPVAYRLDGIHTGAGAQALAWLAGAGLWIALTFVAWLARGRQPQPTHMPEFPTDRTPTTLTRPMLLFALIRALAVAISVAIAFGLNVPNADWMPIATIVAMKPSLQHSTLAAEQRLLGAVLGAVIAAGFLISVDNKTALEVVILVLGVLGATVYGANYTLYTAAIAAAVLIAVDLPHPSNLGDEGRRILFTFIGVGIGLGVMLLAGQLQRRAPRPSQPDHGK